MLLYQIVMNHFPCSQKWARDQKEVTGMNKYELAVVVSANIEDEETGPVEPQ